MIVCITLANAQQDSDTAFSIKGKIVYENKGDMHILLVKESEFDLDSVPHYIKFPAGALQSKKEVAFSFENISAGEYGIKVFQDKNGNGKLDFGFFGPKEPWGLSTNARPKLRAPKFKDISFKLAKSIENMLIRCR